MGQGSSVDHLYPGERAATDSFNYSNLALSNVPTEHSSTTPPPRPHSTIESNDDDNTVSPNVHTQPLNASISSGEEKVASLTPTRNHSEEKNLRSVTLTVPSGLTCEMV